MNHYFSIKDVCRAGLLPYLRKACDNVPKAANAQILDVGCGTGVPTLWFANTHQGFITAIDQDPDTVSYLQHKITEHKLQDRVTALCLPFSTFLEQAGVYDIILAEGFLNVIGFEPGYTALVGLLKPNGYLVIHDEYRDSDAKLHYISANGDTLIDTLFLGKEVWWNNYYRQLEQAILQSDVPNRDQLFRQEISEIAWYRKDPDIFQSIYYVIRRGLDVPETNPV